MQSKETLKVLTERLNSQNESPYLGQSVNSTMAFQTEKEPVVPMPYFGQLRPYSFPQETSPFQGKFDVPQFSTFQQFDVAASANYNFVPQLYPEGGLQANRLMGQDESMNSFRRCLDFELQQSNDVLKANEIISDQFKPQYIQNAMKERPVPNQAIKQFIQGSVQNSQSCSNRGQSPAPASLPTLQRRPSFDTVTDHQSSYTVEYDDDYASLVAGD